MVWEALLLITARLEGVIVMDLGLFFLLFGLGFSLAAPIGPVNMEMLKQALSRNRGWVLGVATGLGAMTGDFIIAFVALTLGEKTIARFVTNSPARLLLYMLNIGLLVFIAWGAWNTQMEEKDFMQSNQQALRVENKDGTNMARGRDPWSRAFLIQYGKGFGILATSPWSYLWWTTFGSYLLTSGIALETPVQRLIATLLFLSGILAWVVLFCGSLGISRKLASVQLLQFITRLSALVILGFALKFVWEAAMLAGQWI